LLRFSVQPLAFSLVFLLVWPGAAGAQAQAGLRFQGPAAGGGGGGLPLDAVTGNYSAAYGLRLLTTNWAGSLVNCLRTSDNATNAFYQGATAGSLNTVSGGSGTDLLTWGAGTTVVATLWLDQTGNGKHRNQSTLAVCPVLAINGAYLFTQNGHPCLSFTNQYFTCVTPYTGIANYTILAVANATASSSAYMGIIDTDSPSSANTFVLCTAATAQSMGIVRSNAGKLKSGTFSFGTAYLWDASYDGTTDALYQNGVSQLTTYTDGGFGGEGSALGAGYAASATRWNGWIAEVIVYSAGKSDGDKATLRSNLADGAGSFWHVYN
jgi:hypothetical protein